MIEDLPEGKTNYCPACEDIAKGYITAVNIHNCGNIKYTDLPTMPQAISISKWCVKCYPKREPAEFTFQGNSLCEECFKKTALT